MRRPPSLTLRLTLLFGIAAVVVFSGFGWLIEASIKRHFAEEDASELESIIDAVNKALFTGPPGDDLAPLERRFDDIVVGHHGASLHIIGPDGQTIYASTGPDISALPQVAARSSGDGSVRDWSDDDHHYRALLRRVSDNTASSDRVYTIAVAVPIDYHLKFLHRFRDTLWLMIASGIAITSLMGWIAVRQGHAPLHDIVTQIRRISANKLNTRLSPETVPAELTDLAVSFNEMLVRMEEAFLRLSNFSGDIAHDLRTPVTNMMTQTQVALSQTRTIDEYREILYSNIEEYERMAQMINDMLFLARADNGLSKPNITEVDLANEVGTLFEYYEAWAEERNVRLTLEGAAAVSGDRLMLQRALSNLLSNAISHTPPGEAVRVELSTARDGEIGIVVENPGAEIAPEHLPKLFDRFYRVDPARQEGGSGFGLAIVKSIVDAHGGNISVVSSEGRTRFQVILPSRNHRSGDQSPSESAADRTQ